MKLKKVLPTKLSIFGSYPFFPNSTTDRSSVEPSPEDLAKIAATLWELTKPIDQAEPNWNQAALLEGVNNRL